MHEQHLQLPSIVQLGGVVQIGEWEGQVVRVEHIYPGARRQASRSEVWTLRTRHDALLNELLETGAPASQIKLLYDKPGDVVLEGGP
jgi:hypothetical protein